jgi:hypothetical protein
MTRCRAGFLEAIPSRLGNQIAFSRLRGWLVQVPAGDQFGHDADGDLWDRLRADVETERRMHARQRLRG